MEKPLNSQDEEIEVFDDELNKPEGPMTSRKSVASQPMGMNSDNKWIFRQKDDELLVLVLYKVFAMTAVNNIDQTFSMTVGEEMAIWLSEEEYNRFLEDPKSFEPDYIPETFPYNGTEWEWDSHLMTTDRCRYYVRKLVNHEPDYGNKCFAWFQRQGRITFDEPFELENFPFDVQPLTAIMQFHSYFHDPDIKIKIRPLYGGCAYARRFVEPQGEYRVYKDLAVFETVERNIRFPQVRCTFCIRREWQFYFWKVALVLSVISLTSVLALIDFDSFLDQTGHLSTILLTDVAYLYIVSTVRSESSGSKMTASFDECPLTPCNNSVHAKQTVFDLA